MAHFRVTAPDGTVLEYDADLPLPEHLGDGWRCEYIHSGPTNTDQDASEESPVYEWSVLDFLRRFTAQERIAARQAAKTDPILEDFWGLLDRATIVRNDDPDVLLGLGYLVQQGLLTAERMKEVMYG